MEKVLNRNQVIAGIMASVAVGGCFYGTTIDAK